MEPRLTNEELEQAGDFGIKHHAFLREHHPKELAALRSSGQLVERLKQVDDEANDHYQETLAREKAYNPLPPNPTWLDREAQNRAAGVMASSETMRNVVLQPPMSRKA